MDLGNVRQKIRKSQKMEFIMEKIQFAYKSGNLESDKLSRDEIADLLYGYRHLSYINITVYRKTHIYVLTNVGMNIIVALFMPVGGYLKEEK